MKNSIKKLLAAGAACFVVLLLMSLFRVQIITPGFHLLMARADERLGLHLSVGSIKGSVWSSLEFHDVSAIANNTDTPLREIICQRIIFHYPLQALWSGLDSLLSYTEVEVDGLHLDVDLKVFSEGTAKQNSSFYRLFALPAILPKIRVNDGTLSLSSTEYTAFVDGISLQVDQNGRSGQGQSVQLTAKSVAYSAPQQRAEYTDITSSFSYSTQEICLDSLLVEGVQHTRKSCLDLTGLSREELAWNLDINIFDGQLNMLGGLEGRDLQLQLSGQELDLARIAVLVGSGVQMNGRLAINSELRLNLDAPADLSASLEISGSDGTIGGKAFEEMGLAASLSERQISVQRFAVRSGDESVAIDNASFPLTTFLDGNGQELLARGAGAFALQIEDLVPWLEAAKIGFPEQMRRHPVGLTGRGEMRQGSVELEQLVLQFDKNRMTLAAAHIPAEFFWSGEGQRWQGITGDFGLRCANIPALMSLYRDHLPLLPAKEPDHLLELKGRLHDDAIVFSAGSLQSESVLVELEKGSISFPADGATLEKMTTDISLKLKIDALDRLAALFHYRDMRGALRGSLELKGPLVAPAGEFMLVGDHLVWSGLELGTMQASGNAADGRFTLEAIEIKHASDYVHGRAIMNVAKRNIEELTINLSVAEMAKYGPLLPDNLRMSGRATASLAASGPFLEPQAEGNILLENAMINKVQLNRAAFSLSGSGRSLRIHSSAGLAGEEGAGANLAGTLSWNSDRSRIAFSLDSMTVQRQAAGFELAQPADFSYQPGKRITVKGFLLQGRSGSIAADGFWVWSGESNLSIRTAGLSGKDWFDALVSDRFFFDDATVRADIGGDWAAPRVTVLGSVGALAGRNAPFSFQGDMDFSIARQTIDIRKFDWQGVDNQGSIHIKGRIPWDQQNDNPLQGEDLFLESQFDLPQLAAISSLLPEEAPVSGSLHGALLLRGSWQKPIGSLQLIGSRLSIPVITRLGSSALFDLNCQLTAQEDGLVMPAFRLVSSELSVDISGGWQEPLSLDALLQGNHSYFVETLLNVDGRLTIADVSWLANSSAAVHRLAGRLDLRAALTGTIMKPEVNGLVELSGGELRTSYAIPTIRSLNIVANIDPQQIVIQSLQGELGGAPFSMTGVIDKYLFGKTQLALSFSGKNLLFYRDAGMKFRGDALLKANGPLDHLALTGEVLLTDGHYLRNVDFFSSFRGTANPESGIDLGGITFREPPLSKADLNIRIGAARAVRIKNNVLDGAVRPDLVLMGTGESPYLVGNIYLDPTKIKLPAGQIKVKSGLIRFTEADPERPEIDLAGESRIMGYEISAQANGFLFEPVITLSSSPPLPEDELLLLLLTGKAPKSDSDSGTVRKGSGRMAMYIGRNILTQWFGSGFVESDESVLERLELEIGRGVSRLGEETIEAQFRLTDSLFNEDDILFITAEKDMYDSFNSGVRLVFRFQ